MGEYATRKSDNERIKIGTCEMMYYLRLEDRSNVNPETNSLDLAKETGLFWRLPFPDEDNILPGGYENHNRGLRLYKKRETPGIQPDSYDDFEPQELVKDHGTIQLRHDCGLMVNMPCYHGLALPDYPPDGKCFWNGKSWFFELSYVKELSDGKIMPIVTCRHCGRMWRFTWDEILPYVNGEIKERLEKYHT